MDDNTVVRCFDCARYVRKVATTDVPTGKYEELETWCLECLQNVDEFTELITSEETENDDLLEGGGYDTTI